VKLSQFKLYRWWLGGFWALLDGVWYEVNERGYISGPCLNDDGQPTNFMCHHAFIGVTRREDYRDPNRHWKRRI
jgi:hypothetical protein